MIDTLTPEELATYFTPEKTAEFWEDNGRAYRRSAGRTKPPFTLVFVEDWVKWKMGVRDHERYYRDLPYQLSLREKCSEYTEATVGVPLNPTVNLGSTIFASLFGGEILYSASSSPWITPVIKEPSDVRSMMYLTRCNDLLERGQIKSWIHGYRLIEESRRSTQLPLFGTYFHGMATMGCMLVGATDFLYLLIDHHDKADLLMQIIGDVAIRFMDAMREFTGDSPTGLIIANDDLSLLSPTLYERFCLEPERRLFDYYSEASCDMRGYHSDSSCDHHFLALGELGLTDINLSPNLTVGSLRRQFPKSVIHGQISPLPFREANVQEAADCAKGILAELNGDPALIMSVVGCLNPGTPVENILAVMLALENYGWHERANSLYAEDPPERGFRLLKGMPMILEVE